MMRILTTGTLSGLGKHLFETFGGISYNRQISEEECDKLINQGVDIILHSAFNSAKDVDSNNLYYYLEDSFLLTEKLIEIPHKKFIFISSVDVYPKDNKHHREDEVIDVNTVEGIYGLTKLMSECLVKKSSPNYLILRCTALIGKHSRKNSLIRIIKDDNPTLTISADSSFNYILHIHISEFIKLALEKNLQGIYNVASSENIVLSEVAKALGKKVNFGTYEYNVGNIDNSKITSIFPAFKKTSKEAILEFIGFKKIGVAL